MHRQSLITFAGMVALAALTFIERPARAGVDACAGIDITSSSQCELVAEGGCETMCTPITVQASCAAELYVSCDGMCTLTASAMCTTDCSATCNAACAVDPGTFDCSASCEGSCEGSCTASCAASADQTQCMASCRATCSGECDASCTGTPPTATCDAKCEASCSGSCTAEANLDCQVDCQTSGFVDCTTTVEGGCETQCQEPGGALFCDGQYVDADSLAACLLYLESQLSIDVDGWAVGECVGNTCTVEAGASCACQAGTRDRLPALGGLLFGLPLLGLLAFGTRRRRRVPRHAPRP